MSEPEFFSDRPRPEYSTVLSEADRAKGMQFLSNPLDFPTGFEGWLRDIIRQEIVANGGSSLTQYLGTTGELLLVYKDYTAETGLYALEAKGGTYLYLNGATYSSTTYPDLYAYLGTTTLADTRGRSIWLCGTNAAVDLGDNDGVTESSRQPKHTHTDSIGLSGSPGGTFVTNVTTNTVGDSSDGSGGTNKVVSLNVSTGSPTVGSLSVNGSVGSGMSGSDAVAHIVVGSLFIRT